MGTHHIRTYHIIKTVKEKKAIVEYCQKHSKAAASRKYNVSYGSILRWVKMASKGGAPVEELLARKPKRHTVKDEAIVFVKKLHAKHPTMPLSELKERVSHIQKISRTTIWHAITGR